MLEIVKSHWAERMQKTSSRRVDLFEVLCIHARSKLVAKGLLPKEVAIHPSLLFRAGQLWMVGLLKQALQIKLA